MTARRPLVPIGALPPGMLYVPGFLPAQEERALFEQCEALEYSQVKMRGMVARRTTAHFGWDYAYDSAEITRGAPLPGFLVGLRARLEALVPNVPPTAWEEVLVSRYPPGASIGWHRDARMFGPVVVGVSLGAPSRLRLRRRAGDAYHVHTVELAPGSAYALGGESRTAWEHTLSPVKGLRYSVTFRTVVHRPSAEAVVDR